MGGEARAPRSGEATFGTGRIDPSCTDEHDRAPLGWAAMFGHEGVVKLLLGRDDVDPNHSDKYDQTPLKCAAVGGHEGVVKLLLDRGDF